MKKVMFTYYLIAFLVSIAFDCLMDVKNWVDFIKNLICSCLAASIIILVGSELNWSVEKICIGIIIASSYARPIVYGVNKQIKEFFKDPKAFIDKYKDMK